MRFGDMCPLSSTDGLDRDTPGPGGRPGAERGISVHQVEQFAGVVVEDLDHASPGDRVSGVAALGGVLGHVPGVLGTDRREVEDAAEPSGERERLDLGDGERIGGPDDDVQMQGAAPLDLHRPEVLEVGQPRQGQPQPIPGGRRRGVPRGQTLGSVVTVAGATGTATRTTRDPPGVLGVAGGRQGQERAVEPSWRC